MATVVRDNAEAHRYELEVDGVLAGSLTYRHRPGQLVLRHMEMVSGFEGRGLGSVLAKGSLDDARARGFTVAPVCSFVAEYIERHPEYRDLVSAEHAERS